MKLGSERTAVQNPLIRYATEVGWTSLSPDEALRLRGGEEGRLLHDVFLTQVQRLNPDVVDRVRAEELAGRLTRVLPHIEGNLEAKTALEALFHSLLHHLMTGKVRVEDVAGELETVQ